MTTTLDTDWLKEFGIPKKRSANFYANKNDLVGRGTPVPQAHVLRRAFDLLELDGVLCSDKAPLIYFKHVQKIEADEAIRLHRDFWNHGGAPLLVLLDPRVVHVYSGLLRPSKLPDVNGRGAGFVDELTRASTALREFLPAVETGEFFRRHAKSFPPEQRVDRDLLNSLQTTRERLIGALQGKRDPEVLDALLCRLVFTCYLFDRGVIDAEYLEGIGIHGASHLRDVLAFRPRSLAKDFLYSKLFRNLGIDFNGDLFKDQRHQEEGYVDLAAEANLVGDKHLDLLEGFFRGTGQQGQQSFWPYNFGVIPVETISAIYERFLKSSDKKAGAFYTRRFLAEVVLDSLLMRTPALIGKTYLDPACGSGIFLVGVFNRIAEEWAHANPDANNNTRARELMKLLQESVFGIDTNPTACRITAFSLYLAYLDQLSPRGIREIQAKKGALPRLVSFSDGPKRREEGKNVIQGDFFAEDSRYPKGVDFVMGNPPWGSIAGEGTPAANWCASQEPPIEIPDYQIAAAFVRKAPTHLAAGGRVCLVLPHGTLFNHGPKAISFQRSLFEQHAVDLVLNLVDYQFFLFAEAKHPALVISYRKEPPLTNRHRLEYLGPKTDWLVKAAEIIAVHPEDRTEISVQEVLNDLAEEDAPQVWKRHFWSTPRDWRLIDRLSSYPRLRDIVCSAGERAQDKPWFMAEGFQPLGTSDDPAKAVGLLLPSKLFIKAKSPNIDLFLLQKECIELSFAGVDVRNRSNKQTEAYRGPHVLVTKGFKRVAFADSDVSFQHAVRGIRGGVEDLDLLIFLAAYLRTSLSRYFIFHTSSNWGVSRQEVHVEEILRLPFPLPDSMPNPKVSWEIVREVAKMVTVAAKQATRPLCDRRDIVCSASSVIEPLVEQYFDLIPVEKVLLEDTEKVIIPSFRPTLKRRVVPTMLQSDSRHRDAYTKRLCITLNGWSKRGQFVVQGTQSGSSELGVGIVVLQRSLRSDRISPPRAPSDLLATMDSIRNAMTRKLNTFQLMRGVKAFDGDMLYLVKPIERRFWTETTALNDADEIAASILMQATGGQQ